MKPDEGYGAQNPVFPFPFSPTIFVVLNNIYEEFPRGDLAVRRKKCVFPCLFFTGSWVGLASSGSWLEIPYSRSVS